MNRRHFLGAVIGAAVALRPRAAHAARPMDVIVVGDSLTANSTTGLVPRLHAAGLDPVKVDALAGRTVPQGWATIRALRAAGFDSRAWVVALGTNDVARADEAGEPMTADGAAALIRATLAELGNVDVAWPTLVSPVPKDHALCVRWNVGLRRVAREDGRLHVVEWAHVARSHPEWFADRHHHNELGVRVRRRMLVDAAVMARRAADRRQSSSDPMWSARARSRPSTVFV